MLRQEEELAGQGYSLTAGIDEVGRGALAGPIVAAAVIFPANVLDQVRNSAREHASPSPHPLAGIRDSKELSPSARKRLDFEIRTAAAAIGIGVVPHVLIDLYGIVDANRLAMCQAVRSLHVQPDFLLLDAFRLSNLAIPQMNIIKGDKSCFSVAAASIVAKVFRDRLMERWDSLYPGYGFARHKGYGTGEHLRALAAFGPCPLHRRSFRPVRDLTP